MDDAVIAVLVAPLPRPYPGCQTTIEWKNVCEQLGIPHHSSFIQQWHEAYEEYKYFCGTLLAKKSRLDDIRVEQRRHKHMCQLEHLRLCQSTRRTALLDGAANRLYHNMNIDYTHANAARHELAKAREYFLEMKNFLFQEYARRYTNVHELMQHVSCDYTWTPYRIRDARVDSVDIPQPWFFTPVPPEVRDAAIALA